MNGGAGNDSLQGNAGNDTFVFNAGWGNDSLYDTQGNNTIDLSAITAALTINFSLSTNQVSDGTNTVSWTGSSVQNAIGGSGSDSITASGGAGSYLAGNVGNDTLNGSSGYDTLVGGSGNDSLSGSAGDDTYLFQDGFGQDIINDTSGFNTIDLSVVLTNLTVNTVVSTGDEITDGTNTVNWSGAPTTYVFTGSGNDSITGSSSSELLESNAGNDTIIAATGDDTLDGGIGNDSLNGGDGNDNYAFENNWGTDTVTDSSGADQVDFSNVSTALNINLTTGTGAEITSGTNSVEFGSSVIENAAGGASDDALTGSSGGNSLWGHAGNDTLIGNAGNDTLIGGDGNDSLDGGTGSDTYIFGVAAIDSANWGNDTITESSGTDVVNLSTVTANLTINLNSGSGNEITDGINTVNWSGDVIEQVVSGSGNDTLISNTNNNSFDGGAGNDTYRFNNSWSADNISQDASGEDTIDFSAVTTALTINMTPSSGNEVSDGTNSLNWNALATIEDAIGGSGNDNITASSSDNVLTGMAGNDTLIGGAGNDTYKFSLSDGQDLIQDSAGTDKVLFANTVSASNVIVFQSGSDLKIGYTSNTTDLITVQGQSTSGTAVERFEVSSGQYMTAAEINGVIAQMSAYAASNSISFTSLNDVRNNANLVQIVNSGWHS